MTENDDRTNEAQGDEDLKVGKAVSRREFLKIAGVAGATIGVGAGLGGLVAACGGTTTTTAGPTTTAAGTTTTAAARLPRPLLPLLSRQALKPDGR